MAQPPIAAVSSGLRLTERALASESTLSTLGFPNEFPYEFDSLTFSSAFISPGDSKETEDETSDDEDDFLAGLTRRLALSTQRLPSPPSSVNYKAEMKPQIAATSPEPTLSGLGSPNGPFSQVPSPPTSPFREEDSLKVISAAAGEVAKLKTANFDAEPTSRRIPNPNSFISFPQNAAFCGYWVWQPQSSHYGLSRQPALIAPLYPARGIFAAPNAVTLQSTGTGVFLPRSYSIPTVSRKKSGNGRVRFPTKIVHEHNPKIEKKLGRYRPHPQACLSTGRSKIESVAGGCLKKERSLPQEWIY